MSSLTLPFKPIPALKSMSPSQAIGWLRAHTHVHVGGALLVAAVLGSFAAISDPAGSIPRTPTPGERMLAAAPPPPVEPMVNKAIAPTTALQINAAVPIAQGPNPSALPFKAPPVKSVAYARALECLTQAVYYEAATESADGQRAVAQVILNRVRHPAYPATVCGVVYQGSERDTGCQFSFTCDGSLARAPMKSYWDRARMIAHAALQGQVYGPVGNATHYHADYVVPYWAATLSKSAVVGLHIFYRWTGGWGLPAAFVQKYTAKEADPYALKAASLAAEARDRATPDAAVEMVEGEEAVIVARKELPPELAKLVEAEIGAKGETRVAMKIPPNAGSRESLAQLDKALKSPNLNWGLTGAVPSGADQKPLGKSPAGEAPAPAASTPAEN